LIKCNLNHVYINYWTNSPYKPFSSEFNLKFVAHTKKEFPNH
jgi:hypothetical protein